MAPSTNPAPAAEPQVPPSVLRLLDARPRVEVLWLDPDPAAEGAPRVRVRGRAWVGERDAARVVEAVRAALRAADGSMMCFDPEYAVRLEAGGQAAELQFCFPCRNAQVAGPDGAGGLVPCTDRPRRLLRRLLRSAGVLPWWRFWG